MKRLLAVLILIPVFGYSITADQIIQNVDANQVYSTMKFSATMTVQKGSQKLVKCMIGYGTKADSKAYIEYTNRQDFGVKFLKLKDQLWIYFPDADDVMKISGQMLRQGMMGSDISYEDMMENESLDTTYTKNMMGETNIGGIACYRILLTAKNPSTTYQKEIISVDKSKFVLVEADLYAVGGRLIRKIAQSGFQTIGRRYFPKIITIRDMRRTDSVTTIEYHSVAFDIAIDATIFDVNKLRR